MTTQYRIVVCASGGGGNLQAIIDNATDIKICKIIADRECGALQRAKNHKIDYKLLKRTPNKRQLFAEFEAAIPADTDLIVLAGFMPIIPAKLCEKWQGRMINTHPSLLPKYGGKGMYGVKVQQAVMAAKEVIAGCTIHYVSSDIDAGAIIAQKSITVDYKQTPWQLGGRIFKQENQLLVATLQQLRAQRQYN